MRRRSAEREKVAYSNTNGSPSAKTTDALTAYIAQRERGHIR